MTRSPIAFVLPLFALALAAIPAAFAKDGNGAVRTNGVCTQQSTSKLKLSREDRGIEVEFEIDQNRSGVPWRVTLSRNGNKVATITARTHAPSGSFEVNRVIAARAGARITAIATRASGETCTAHRTVAAAGTAAADDNGHEVGDDHGGHSARHA